MDIAGKIAIVTGGASGLGAATVAMLCERGAQVVIFDIDEQLGAKIATHHCCAFMCTNVFKVEEVDASMEALLNQFGPPSILVNCAGVAPCMDTLRANREIYPFEIFVRTVEVNLFGTALMSIRFAYYCKMDKAAAENGVIINTASIAAFDGQAGHIAYAASKAGVIGMTLPMARDLAGSQIRVVTIAPGIFDTPLMKDVPGADRVELCTQVPHPNRMGLPKEFAMMAEQIILNPMLNGEVIRLDGALRFAPF
ncbi:MAG: SDR family NAD(P)-dependent oxidoreductase [Sphingorhabdus sp.]|uniref:SDR family NAD(P)-dependent oxidoreductase n=1 Tax=Sphingorhabdus sp. TaxID=1902408 RepID=UPI0038FCFA46